MVGKQRQTLTAKRASRTSLVIYSKRKSMTHAAKTAESSKKADKRKRRVEWARLEMRHWSSASSTATESLRPG
jgi:hypothetical protein